MSDQSFRCRLVTPTNAVLDERVTYANVPAWDGLIGIAPKRAPIVVRLGLGELTLRFPESADTRGEHGGGGERMFYLDGGFAQMVGDELLILAESAVPAEKLSASDTAKELDEASAATVPGDAEDKFEAAEAIRMRRQRARLKARIAGKSLAGGRGI